MVPIAAVPSMSHVFERPGPVNINAHSGDRLPFLGRPVSVAVTLFAP